MIGHQTHHLHLACNLLLGFGEHCQQHISSDALGHQKLTAVAAQGDLETNSQQESFAVGVPKGIRHRDLFQHDLFPERLSCIPSGIDLSAALIRFSGISPAPHHRCTGDKQDCSPERL